MLISNYYSKTKETKEMSFIIGKYCGITLTLLHALSIVFHTALKQTIVLSMEELIQQRVKNNA